MVAAAVDRLGRNVVDCLNTGYKMRDEKKMLVTYGHDGAWNPDDPADENRFTMEAWGAQMELRAIQRRNRDATVKARAAGRPKGKPSYGFQYVRKVMGGKIDQVELHPHASEVLRNVARRILADPDNVTCSSEAARLNRAGEPSPADHLAVTYGKLTGGRPWLPQSLKNILSRKAPWSRRSNREYLLTTVALCGQCHTRLYTQTLKDAPPRYTCTARNKGWLQAQHCRPAPLINAHLLDAYVEEWFLRELGDGVNGGPVGSKSGMGSQTGSQLLDGQGAVEDEIRSLLYGGDVFSVTRGRVRGSRAD
ncbi:recombinase family protein [Streptomyces sp. M54]|uniref:recombinase family protein n=2 Tax=Streptomyces TaxID=1883 RepID=UPI001FB12B46|nr:recombinase family protein [Streptomyces sp. M54]